jgi:hypothetical protein
MKLRQGIAKSNNSQSPNVVLNQSGRAQKMFKGAIAWRLFPTAKFHRQPRRPDWNFMNSQKTGSGKHLLSRKSNSGDWNKFGKRWLSGHIWSDQRLPELRSRCQGFRLSR